MSYSILVYLFFGLISVFALNGVNFDSFIKKNHVWEARFLLILLSMAIGYLAGSFFLAFFE